MQTRITARHTTISDSQRGYIESAVAKLNRYYNGIHDAHVVLNGEDEVSKTAEVKVNVYRRTLTAQDNAPTYDEAVAGCVRQLKRQVIRYKERTHGTDKDVHR